MHIRHIHLVLFELQIKMLRLSVSERENDVPVATRRQAEHHWRLVRGKCCIFMMNSQRIKKEAPWFDIQVCAANHLHVFSRCIETLMLTESAAKPGLQNFIESSCSSVSTFPNIWLYNGRERSRLHCQSVSPKDQHDQAPVILLATMCTPGFHVHK